MTFCYGNLRKDNRRLLHTYLLAQAKSSKCKKILASILKKKLLAIFLSTQHILKDKGPIEKYPAFDVK